MSERFQFSRSTAERRWAWLGLAVAAAAWAAVIVALAPAASEAWQHAGVALPLFAHQWFLWGLMGLTGVVVFVWRVLRVQEACLVEEGLEVVTHLGPWTWRRVVPRADVLDVLTHTGDGSLYARTPIGPVTLVSAGSRDQREAARSRLRALLDLGHVARTALPPQFIESSDSGSWVIGRRAAGRVAWGLVGGVGVAVGAGFALWWVVPLAALVLVGAMVREEWLVTQGCVVRRWRLGPLHWLRGARLTGLRVEKDADSDEAPWFRLVATGSDGPRVLFSAAHDAEDPASLGEHLAKRAGLRLEYGPGCEAVAGRPVDGQVTAR